MTSRASRFSLPADRVAAALAAGGLFLVAWGGVHLWFWAHGQIVDWPTYLSYGEKMRDGLVPYRDFAVEYPPGSLLVFVLPTWAHGDYASSFAWLMALCGVLLVAVVASVRPAAAFYVALGPLLVGSLILSRFDLWPALLATAALALLVRGRHAWGWGLLGAAVAAKLWPLVLVPLALAWSIRRGRPLAPLAGAAVVLVVSVPFLIASPGGLWASLS